MKIGQNMYCMSRPKSANIMTISTGLIPFLSSAYAFSGLTRSLMILMLNSQGVNIQKLNL
jgi:hypothetical protein